MSGHKGRACSGKCIAPQGTEPMRRRLALRADVGSPSRADAGVASSTTVLMLTGGGRSWRAASTKEGAEMLHARRSRGAALG